MNKKYKYIEIGDIINLTLLLTAENENRYIIDTVDIERFLKTFKTNLTKQNITLCIEGERLGRNSYYSNTIQEISYDHNQNPQYSVNSPYYILLPYYDLNDLCKDFAAGLIHQFIRACYQDSLYQSLSPRSAEDLQNLNEIYINFLNQKEEENTQQYELYNQRRKQIIKQKQRIKS